MQRLEYGELTDTSTPSLDTVTEWIEEAEAETRGVLRANKVAITYADGSDGALILRKHVVDYAEGRVRSVWASADGDGENEDGQREIERYNDRIRDIQNRPSVWAAMLSDSGDAPSDSLQGRSNATSTSAVQPDPLYSLSNIDRAF